MIAGAIVGRLSEPSERDRRLEALRRGYEGDPAQRAADGAASFDVAQREMPDNESVWYWSPEVLAGAERNPNWVIPDYSDDPPPEPLYIYEGMPDIVITATPRPRVEPAPRSSPEQIAAARAGRDAHEAARRREEAQQYAAELAAYSAANRVRSAAFGRELGGAILQNTPIVGDALGIYDAVRDPTPVSVAAATIGLVPIVGDAAGKGLRGLERSGALDRAGNWLEGVGNWLDDAWRRIGKPKCFAAGTLIQTRGGLKRIEDIREGDMVWSRSERDVGEAAWRQVTEWACTGEQEIYDVHASTPDGRSETYRTTNMHPFWIETGGDEGKGGFVAAGWLERGDRLRLGDGSAAYVTSVEATGLIEPVYNFSVEGWHTYHVGELGVWVHNVCFGALPQSVQDDLAMLGVNSARYASDGNTVAMQIRMIGDSDPARTGALLRTLQFFRSADSGVNAVTVQTGPVINARIAERLSTAVRNNESYLGMSVTTRGTSHLNGVDYPAYMLQWWRQ